jgi:hypothetical protein
VREVRCLCDCHLYLVGELSPPPSLRGSSVAHLHLSPLCLCMIRQYPHITGLTATANAVGILIALAPPVVKNLVAALRVPPTGTIIREVVVALGSRLGGGDTWFLSLADLAVRVCEGANSAWYTVLHTAGLGALVTLVNAVRYHASAAKAHASAWDAPQRPALGVGGTRWGDPGPRLHGPRQAR